MRPKINIVEPAGFRVVAYHRSRQFQNAGLHLGQRAIHQPIRVRACDAVAFSRIQRNEIIRGGPRQRMRCVAAFIQHNFGNACRSFLRHSNVLSANSKSGKLMECAAPALIISDSADEDWFMTKPHQVSANVEWRSAEMLGTSNYVPEDFANAEHAHPYFSPNLAFVAAVAGLILQDWKLCDAQLGRAIRNQRDGFHSLVADYGAVGQRS